MINRLSHIPTLIFSTPSQSPNTIALARAALLRLIPLLRGTLDVGLYNTTLAYLARVSAASTGAGARDDSMGADESASAVSGKEAEGVPDNEWIEDAGETERKENSRLDVELRGYMSNLIKESIRVSASPASSGAIDTLRDPTPRPISMEVSTSTHPDLIAV